MYARLLVFLIVAICAVAIVWLVPLLAIWAINVLFDTTIAYNFINWFAMLLLLALFGRGSRWRSSDRACGPGGGSWA